MGPCGPDAVRTPGGWTYPIYMTPADQQPSGSINLTKFETMQVEMEYQQDELKGHE